MLTESQQDDSKQDENTWDPPSSSLPGTSTDDSNITKTYRKKYRSKSAVSTDPRSPYYSSQGIVNEDSLKFGGKFTKAPSVSCVPGYDGHKYADIAKKSYLPFNGGIPGLNLSPDDPKAATIRQHYYPEGGWGYVVCFCAVLVEIMSNGLIYSFGLLLVIIMPLFGQDATIVHCISVGALSISFSMALSPIIVALSRKKSARLMAILGGLVTALGMLFTSFASQLHQLFFSYGLFVGGGVSLTRDTAAVVVGQYFKRKREFVEIFVTSGSGISMAAMPLLMSQLVRSMGWRLGLQTVTGLVSLTFVLGIFYRPASLYHPQRRAILHIKGLQKRSKAKDKSTSKEKPPFFDFSVLKSRTVQILISGSALSAFGINAPILLLMHQGRKEGLDYYSLVHLQVFMGLASSLGTAAFGFIIVKNSVQCLIARQYLSQASCFVMALALLAFINLKDYHGYLLFVWVYGFFYGGYQYSLKMFTFEKVRARNFSRAWGYLQFSLAIPHLVGLPLTGYLNDELGHKKGFYFASACISAGSLFLFLIDVHKWNVRKQKDSYKLSQIDVKPGRNKENRNFSQRSSLQDIAMAEDLFQNPARSFANFASELRRQELTCISEEVVMENFLEDFMDDCITSCNKEEKYLMLSEYENNLNNSQETKPAPDMKKVPVQRKMSTVSPPLLEQCPNCLRVVPVDGVTNCQALNVEDVASNWRDQITTLV